MATAWLAVIALAGASGAFQLRAEEVSTEHLGLDVLGNLEIARGKSLKADGAVLLLHDTLAHHRMEIISAQQELLRERGINSLAMTLSLGLNKRRGMFNCAIEQDHRHNDAVDEIQTWIDWLKAKGASSIILAGHGRGASQMALYASRKPDKLVKKLVLIAPMAQTSESAEAEYQARFHRSLREALMQAQALVTKENPQQLIQGVGFLECPVAKVTTGAFADYYTASPRFFTPDLLPDIKMPVLVIVGDQDPVEPQLTAGMEASASLKNVSYERIAGADHFFGDQSADQLADKIKEFLVKKAAPSAAGGAPAPGPSLPSKPSASTPPSAPARTN